MLAEQYHTFMAQQGVGAVGHVLLLTLLVSMPFTLLACGRDSQSAEKVKPIVACDLFTSDEAAAYLGGAVDEPLSTHNGDDELDAWISMCNWYSPETNSGFGLQIRNAGATDDPVAAFEAYEAEIREQAPDWDTVPVEGLGDVAAWEASLKELIWFSGPYALSVTVVSPDQSSDNALELATQVAHETEARLK